MIAALCVQVGNDLRDYGKHQGLGSLSHTTHRGIDHHLQQKPRGLVCHPREKESLCTGRPRRILENIFPKQQD